MPRKTLALISGLVLVTVVLFVIALRSTEQKQMTPPPTVTQEPSPTSVAHSVLTLAPNPVTVAPGKRGQVDVNIDTSDNAVTAVQLELGYDPTVLSNVQVTTGPLFQNPVVLVNKNDPKTGRMTYAFGITPTGQTVTGTGTVATISFTVKGAAGTQSQLSLLPTTLVTARGVASSVLQRSEGTIVVIGNGGTTTSTTPNTNSSTGAAVAR